MKKLRSERGASILMALVLLLLASMVSAVILTAATSAARRVRNDRETQQDYLLVSSAAEMIRDSIQADKYYREVQITTYLPVEETVDGVTTSYTPEPTIEMSETGLDEAMGEWLKAGIDGKDKTKAVSIVGSSDVIELSMPEIRDEDGEEIAMKTVLAEFVMDSGSGNITVKLHIKPETETEGASADSEEDCRMTLTLKGNYDEKTYTLTGGSDMGENVAQVEVRETTITWESGKIVKGIKEADSAEAEQ